MMNSQKGETRQKSHSPQPQRNHQLRNKFNQRSERFLPQNHQVLMKEIFKDHKKWKAIPCSWVRRTSSIKIPVLPAAVCRINAVPSKMPTTFFTELEATPAFTRTHRRLRVAKAIRRQEKSAQRQHSA